MTRSTDTQYRLDGGYTEWTPARYYRRLYYSYKNFFAVSQMSLRLLRVGWHGLHVDETFGGLVWTRGSFW